MIRQEGSLIGLAPEFWHIVRTFYPVLQEPEVTQALILHSLHRLQQAYQRGRRLDFTEIASLAHEMNDEALEKQVAVLRTRQQRGSQFLVVIQNKKASEKMIKMIKSESALRDHLTLIADTCFLVGGDLPLVLFRHIHTLVNAQSINQWMPLAERVVSDFACECQSCREILYQDEIPEIAKAFQLPIVNLPDAAIYQHLLSSKEQPAKLSAVSSCNPFQVLGVSPTDSKSGIMQKVMNLMQQQPTNMGVLRQAQHALFHPAQRFLQHYVHCFVYEDSLSKAYVPPCTPLAKWEDIPLRQELWHAN